MTTFPIDIEAKEITGVQIGTQGHKLWVCVDGACVLRVKSPIIEFDEQYGKDKEGVVVSN